MTLVSHQERPYGGFLMAFFYHVVVAHDEHPASASASYLISGSRLHHWLPTSHGCPCLLRDAVLSLYPTTGSALPMGMGQRSRLCRSVHPIARRLRSSLGRSPYDRASAYLGQ